MDSNVAGEGPVAGVPLGKLTDAELEGRLGELRAALAVAALVPGGSERWRELELEIAEVMREQADRVCTGATVVGSLAGRRGAGNVP